MMAPSVALHVDGHNSLQRALCITEVVYVIVLRTFSVIQWLMSRLKQKQERKTNIARCYQGFRRKKTSDPLMSTQSQSGNGHNHVA
jgi:hypothetical protein